MVVYLICIDIESFIKLEVLISTSWHAHVHYTHGAICAMMYMVQCVPWCMCNGVLGAMCASFFQIHPVECSGAASTKRTDCGSSRCSMCIYVLCEAMCYMLCSFMCYALCAAICIYVLCAHCAAQLCSIQMVQLMTRTPPIR